jgi:hypothetical protein
MHARSAGRLGCGWPPGSSGATLDPYCASGGVAVMSGPQDQAAAGRDRLRAGRADREQVIEALKDAFVQGRLTRDELGARAGQALSARTYAELAALTAGIPAGPAAAGRWPGRPPGRLAAWSSRSPPSWSALSSMIRFTLVPLRAGFPCSFPWPLPPYSRQGLFS